MLRAIILVFCSFGKDENLSGNKKAQRQVVILPSINNEKKELRKLKLIWDFYGDESAKTAEHHAKHLGEYLEKNQPKNMKAGWEQQQDSHAIAYMIIMENDMLPIRDALRPHRATVYTED